MKVDSNTNVWLAMWSSEGLEFLWNYTEWEEISTWNLLLDKSTPMPFSIDALKLRAQYNMQRHYEIYIFSIERSILYEDLKNLFDSTPQMIVDLIRKNGHCICSYRDKGRKVII